MKTLQKPTQQWVGRLTMWHFPADGCSTVLSGGKELDCSNFLGKILHHLVRGGILYWIVFVRLQNKNTKQNKKNTRLPQIFLYPGKQADSRDKKSKMFTGIVLYCESG